MPIVVLEGLDAAGKATNAARLLKRVNLSGREGVIYSFPRYETEVGKAILRHLMKKTLLAEVVQVARGALTDEEFRRAPEDALAFQCLMLADKYDAAVDMNADLRAGKVIICDRWTPSALAFGVADGLDVAWLNRVQERLPKGDINIFIDVPEEEALRRRPKLRDRYETNRELQQHVRENYRAMWSVGGVWRTVDGVGTEDEVHDRIWKIVGPMIIGGSSR
jgi:dTMP kinase